MFARLARSTIAFGLVFIAYQAYTLAVAPLIDPPSLTRSAGRGGGSVVTVSPVEKYQRLLASYFPAGHWSLTGKPKVIESGQVMLIVDDYLRDNRGRVDLTRCAVVLFPTTRRAGQAPPRDAVIIEAPGGANLQFDEEFNPSRGSIGNLVQAVLPGRITIRSDMKEPGPADDLLIETSDLQMNESRILTQGAVNFRLGKNRGRGRVMEIILLQEEFKRPGSAGFGFSGVKHLELFDDVRLELQVGKLNLTEDVLAADARPPRPAHLRLTAARQPDAADAWADGAQQDSIYAAPTIEPTAKPAATPPAQARPKPQPIEPPAPPLEIVCQGSFHLSFLDFTATFNENVLATQLSLTGQSDQLTCEQLAIRFTDANGAISPQNDPDFAQRQRTALGDLTPTLLEATGDPVNMDSPSRGAHARARSLLIDLQTRRLTLDGGSPTMLQGGNELRAPKIQYQHPAKGDPAALGLLWLAGPGQMRVVPKADDPQDIVEARWNAVPGLEFPVQLTRENGQPVLMVEGRPQVISSRIGRLTSDRMRVAFREVPADGKDGPAIELGSGSGEPRALLPERINAVGAVQIESPELTGRSGELVVWVRPDTQQLELSPPGGGGRALAAAGQPGSAPQKTYHLAAQKMQMDLLLRGRRATPANLVCQGAVNFSEDAAPGVQATPFSVTGERLKVNNLQSGSVLVQVEGASGRAAGAAASLAEIVAQGMTLSAATVKLDQAANRLWADGAGNARVSVNRDLLGQTTSAATALHLKWQGGLDFDGRKIVVKQDVLGDGPHDWVRCQEVHATLSRPINFANSRGATRDIQIETIDCLGGVTMDHRGVDAQGQVSHEHGKVESLSINQTTGQISGNGPGWIRSVRLENAGNPFALATTAAPPKPKPAGGGLQFLRVRFLKGVSGNLLPGRRQVTFHGNVQTVYGPVLEWEQELPLNHPGGLPPDTGTLKCEQLTVNEDPLAGLTGSAGPAKVKGLGPIELRATGNVQIQGAQKGKGLFTAYAHAASYNKAKEEFSLEGNGQSLAKLYQQDSPGSQPRTSEAQKLTYYRDTGVVKIGGFSHGSSGPANSAQLPGGHLPGAQRR